MHKASIVTILISLLCFSSFVATQQTNRYVVQGKNDPVKITYLQNGLLKLQSRTAQGTVNLKGDLYGCLRQYDSSVRNPKPASADGISIRVLDEVIKGDKFFLVLQISIGSGCNVQGRCGGGEEVAVYFFQFDAAFKREKFQQALITSCYQDVELDEWDGKRGDGQPLNLETKNGRLSLKYTKHDYAQESNNKTWSLVYDRATPEQGFQVSEIKTKN